MDPDFADFVAQRGPALLRTATLLCAGDRAAGEDLLQGALEKVLRQWRRQRLEHPEAYVRQALVRAATRRRTRRFAEIPTEAVPEPTETGGQHRVLEADALRRALAALAPRQRAAVILRFYDDQSEAETARLLGCSVGTVKGYVSRGLARLRIDEHLTDDARSRP